MGYIYLITNTINKKQYVGQTIQKDIKSRWKQHRCMSSYTIGKYLLDSYRKYGISNFKFQLICICFDEDVDSLEKYYIQKFNTLAPNGYNLTRGGNHRYLNEESKNKIRITLVKRVGKKHTAESKEKIRQANLGCRNGNYGKKMSNEQRKKITETMKNQRRIPTSNQMKALNEYRCCYNKKKVGKYDNLNNLLETYGSISEAAKQNGITHSSISKVCRNLPHQKTAGGFVWKYIE